MIRLLYSDVSLLDADTIPDGFSAYRKNKLLRQKNEQARRLGIGAEMLLNQAVYSTFPDTVFPLEICCGANGKPELPGSGIYFSLSHSDTLAACGVSDMPLGIDVEKIKSVNPGVAERFYSVEEKKYLKKCRDPNDAFVYLWTVKESYIKAKGLSLAEIGQVHAEFIPGSDRIRIREDTDWIFSSVRIGGFWLSVCSPAGKNEEPQIIHKKLL